MKKTLTVIFTIIIAIALVAACSEADRPPTVDELLSLGEQFLLDGNYAQALIQFRQAIEVEPMNPRGYTGAAEAYVGLGDYGRAGDVLEEGQRVIGEDVGIMGMLESVRRAEEERWQTEIEAEVERRLAEIEAEEVLRSSASTTNESDDSSHTENMPNVDLALSYLDILESIGASVFGWGGTYDGVDSVSIIDLTNDGIPELVFVRIYQQWRVDFYVYGYQNDQVIRLLYIEELEAYASNPGWDAYFTEDSRLIVRGSNGGELDMWSRILVYDDLTQPASETTLHWDWDWEFTARSWLNGERVGQARIDAELDVIYWGANYRLISVGGSDIEPRDGAVDVSMTFHEAVEFLRSNPF